MKEEEQLALNWKCIVSRVYRLCVFKWVCHIYRVCVQWWWSFLYKIFARSFKSNCGETIRSTFQGCLVSAVHPMQNTNTHVLFVRVPNQQSTLHFVSCPVDGWELFMQHRRAMAWCGMLSLWWWWRRRKAAGDAAQAFDPFGWGFPVQVFGFDRRVMKLAEISLTKCFVAIWLILALWLPDILQILAHWHFIAFFLSIRLVRVDFCIRLRIFRFLRLNENYQSKHAQLVITTIFKLVLVPLG